MRRQITNNFVHGSEGEVKIDAPQMLSQHREKDLLVMMVIHLANIEQHLISIEERLLAPNFMDSPQGISNDIAERHPEYAMSGFGRLMNELEEIKKTLNWMGNSGR